MFKIPEDDSHIIQHLEYRNYWKELEESTIKSADEAICILRNNLYGNDCDDNKILEAMEYLCDEFSLPLFPYPKKMIESFVSKQKYEYLKQQYEAKIKEKDEFVGRQVKRLVNELYKKADTLDVDTIDNAITTLAWECDLALESEKQLKVQRKA